VIKIMIRLNVSTHCSKLITHKLIAILTNFNAQSRNIQP
jgi:hypothetical protein